MTDLGDVVRLTALGGETGELGEVEPIGLDRMKAKISFEFAMSEEGLDTVS